MTRKQFMQLVPGDLLIRVGPGHAFLTISSRDLCIAKDDMFFVVGRYFDPVDATVCAFIVSCRDSSGPMIIRGDDAPSRWSLAER